MALPRLTSKREYSMSNKMITLSGAATDVLYALFFRGALQSGGLPSKSGSAELRAGRAQHE